MKAGTTAVAPARIAVVGHTNTGKTSLLRTLLRDPDFGDVSPRAGTTRAVTGATLLADATPIAEVFDSPGLEDPAALAARVPASGTTGRARLEAFLATPAAAADLAQEAKVIRLALNADLLLHVIDCREPVAGRQLRELEILQLAGRPIIPVLNFTADPAAAPEAWRKRLAELQLHTTVAFDSVLYDAAGERRLYTKIQGLLDPHFDAFQHLIATRMTELGLLQAQARGAIARLLAIAAGLGVTVERSDAGARRAAEDALRETVRALEAACSTALVQTWRHRLSDLALGQLQAQGAPWTLDLYSADTLKQLGVSASRGAATGVALGLGIDVLTGGLTLGAATGLGASLGAAGGLLAQGWRRLLQNLRGQLTLVVDAETLTLLAHRQLALLAAIESRGHASLAPLTGQGAAVVLAAPALARAIGRGRRLPPLSPDEALGLYADPDSGEVDAEPWLALIPENATSA